MGLFSEETRTDRRPSSPGPGTARRLGRLSIGETRAWETFDVTTER